MRSCILRHDGSYAVETINSSVVWSKNHYQTKNKTYRQLEEQHHLKSEHDWIMAHGRGSLWMCAIPINSVVINALQKMTGDLRFVFNFADRDCPEYFAFMQKKTWAENQAAYQAQLDKMNQIRTSADSSSQNGSQGAYEDPVPKEEYEKLHEIQKSINYYDDGEPDYYRPDVSAKRELDTAGYFVSEDSQLFFKINSLDDAINALVMYAFYKSLVLLPYGESATDDLPTLEGVTLNGDPVTIFEEILHYVYESMFDKIPSENQGKYYILMNRKKQLYKVRGGIIPAPSKIGDKYKELYIGIGKYSNPLCVCMSKKEYKHAYRTRSIECILNFYQKAEFKAAIQEGKELHDCGNEYLESGTVDITDVLLFAIAFPYLVSIISGKLLQHERDVIIGYDTTFHIRGKDGAIDPQVISVNYITIDALNQIWGQLTGKSHYRYNYWS